MSWWDRGAAALNAVVGDYLDERGSGLAIEMGLFHRGRPLRALPNGTGKLCVFVHGMGLTERCWAFPTAPESDFGRLLERDRGLTPLYVRYNTGLPIWKNGEQLAALLSSVVDESPVPVEEITLLGHSLGGLVIRSACHHGKGQNWLPLVRRAFYLASPHLGAPLEKAGHVATSVLQAINDPVVQLIAELAEIRSAAVKDLRHGDLVESRQPVPLDERIEHYLIAGSLPGPLGTVLGDGMVRVSSATGAAASEPLLDHVGLFPGRHHMALLYDEEVYAWIARRCGPVVTGRPVEPQVRGEQPTKKPGAYLDLLGDAVDKGSTAVQEVHEAMASRPYDLVAAIPSLRAASRTARAAHFAALRGTYAAVRVVNGLVGVAVRTASRDEGAEGG